MPEQDQHASELDHAEEVGRVIFPAGDHTAVVMQPGEQTLNVPAAAIAAQAASVLGYRLAAVVPVRGNQLDPVPLPEQLIQRVTVVGAVTDQPRRRGAAEA